MRFGLLGPLACWNTDGTPVRVPETKVRALLADLLLHEGGVASADRLADDLWGDQLPGNPANALQTKVSLLRRALERAEPGAGAWLVHQPPGYALRVPPGGLDVTRFRELVGRARTVAEPRERVALLSDALASWRGNAVADFADEPFAVAAVRRLTEERLVAVEELAEARLELGEYSVLAGELGDLVARHPSRERLRALQMRALYRAGRQGEALASFADLRARLVDELGLEPGPELVALHQAVLAQDPGLAGAPAPPTTAARRRTNLPVPATELVGRAEAVRDVAAALSAARLVTLTGTGGVGKTRLATAAAAELAGTFADGGWLVELASIDRRACPESSCPAAEWIVEVTAAALDVNLAPAPGDQAEPLDRLADAVRGREALLVLDNCESVIEPAAQLAAWLLAVAPRLRILATSQEPLDIAGETLWPVPPLDEPDAVRLFLARAADVTPGFTVDEGNAATVAAICRRLDGVPLALELAATRVRALGVDELLARLGDRFRVLTAGRRDAPERQQTLRATIDWSWQLLTAAERQVLRRLAVHADGCTAELAEAVCAGGDVDAAGVVDVLARLVDRSLVVARDRPGGRRFVLLESVTAYCLERLVDAGELDAVRREHAEQYAALAERADRWLRGPEQRHWLDRLDAEAANLRSALETATEQDDAALALRLVTAQTWYWFLRGRVGEARRSLRRVLAMAGATGERAAYAAAWAAGLAVLAGSPAGEVTAGAAEHLETPGFRSRARWFLGYVLATVGDMPAARRLTGDALAEFRELDDGWGIAAALSDRASQELAAGNVDRARRDAVAAAARWEELGDRWGQLQAAFPLGALAQITGDYDRAAQVHRQSLHRAEELGLWAEVSYQLSWLGRGALLTGDTDQAREFHERAMRLGVEHGFKPAEMYAETGLALGARKERRLDVAERHLRSVLAWHRRVGYEPGSTLILAELGFVAELRGEAETARRRHEEGYALAERSGDPRAVALALEGLAGADAVAGEHGRAARLLGAAERLRASVGVPLPPAERGDVDRIATAAREALGEAAYTAELAQGADLPHADLAPA